MKIRSTLIGLALAVSANAVAPAAYALDVKWNHVKISPSSNAFDKKPVFRVVASDDKWLHVRSETAYFPLKLDISVKRGEISSAGVAIGEVLMKGVSILEPSWDVTGIEGKKSVKTTAKFANAADKTFLGTDRQPVQLCNNLMTQGKRPDREHKINIAIPMQIAVIARRGNAFNPDIEVKKGSTTMPGIVVCEKASLHYAKPGKTSAKDVKDKSNAKPQVRYKNKPEPKRVNPAPVRTNPAPVRTNPMKVTKAQMGIKTVGAANACPRNVKLTAWFFTDKPGTVKFRLRKAGGGQSGVMTAKAVKGSGGVYLATYSKNMQIGTPTFTKYMAEVVGAPVITNWVPLNVSCH